MSRSAAAPSTVLHKGTAILLVLLVALGAGACQRFAEQATPSPTTPPTQVAPAVQTATPTQGAPATVSNRILYVGNDFEIYTISPDGSDPLKLTDERRVYTWPTWSPSGRRVAFSSFSLDPFGPGKAIYSVDAAGGALNLIFENAPDSGPAVGLRIPHYSLWSPDGEHVAVLAMSELTLSLYLVSASGQEKAQFLANGAPLYLAWSNDSQSLLVHRQDELLRVDIEAPGRSLNLEAHSSGYRAPGWSPTGDTIAFLEADEDGETLYVARFDGSRRRALARLRGMASFLWAPQGNRLAIGQSPDGNDPFLQDIQVIDVTTGEVLPLVQRPILAFFWSPDGSRVAYVTTNNGETALQWRVVEVRTGQDTKLVDFHPSSDQLTLLAFFDQYAYSHQVWSPDSSRLVFAGALAEGADPGDEEGPISQIFVLDADGNAPPQAIAPGLLASWSMR